MPVIRSAKKKLRKDQKREEANKKIRANLSKVLKAVSKNPNPKLIASAFSSLDKAAKNNIIHKNKAARVKSRLSKFTKQKAPKSTPKSAIK